MYVCKNVLCRFRPRSKLTQFTQFRPNLRTWSTTQKVTYRRCDLPCSIRALSCSEKDSSLLVLKGWKKKSLFKDVTPGLIVA